jgi:hypothetical protein
LSCVILTSCFTVLTADLRNECCPETVSQLGLAFIKLTLKIVSAFNRFLEVART